MGPVIASVSLGAERLFRLKGKSGGIAFAERLPHGSLLIMAGDTKKSLKHGVPKEPCLLNCLSVASSARSTGCQRIISTATCKSSAGGSIAVTCNRTCLIRCCGKWRLASR